MSGPSSTHFMIQYSTRAPVRPALVAAVVSAVVEPLSLGASVGPTPGETQPRRHPSHDPIGPSRTPAIMRTAARDPVVRTARRDTGTTA